MFYDPRTEPHGLPHNPWTALITPRPIGWISSRAPDGTPNLAPYSFFNAVAGAPPFVMFSSSDRKDSITNIEASGVFACNIATWDLREAMNMSSAPVDPGVDEFALAGLEMADCRNIDCPRVAAAPIVIECLLSKTVTLDPSNGAVSTNIVAFGEVVGIHIDESVLTDGLVDPSLVKPLARMGYMDYSVASEVFPIPRPVVPKAE